MKTSNRFVGPLAFAIALSAGAFGAWQSDIFAQGPAGISQALSDVTVSIAQGATGKGPQAYGPNPLQVEVGTTVTWVNDDTAPHTVTSDSDGQLKSGNLTTGQSFKHQFNTPGTYPYHCAIHGQVSMSGVVQVGTNAVQPGAGGGSGESPRPGSTPTPASTYSCDAQGKCCDPSGSCTSSEHYFCDSTGYCCDENRACSGGYSCEATGYCCNNSGHCGSTKKGSGQAHCTTPSHCCDSLGGCANNYTCNGTQCCTPQGKCVNTAPPPTPGVFPTDTPTDTPSSAPSSSPSNAAPPPEPNTETTPPPN